jgi:hypothetical protein
LATTGLRDDVLNRIPVMVPLTAPLFGVIFLGGIGGFPPELTFSERFAEVRDSPKLLKIL